MVGARGGALEEDIGENVHSGLELLKTVWAFIPSTAARERAQAEATRKGINACLSDEDFRDTLESYSMDNG